VAVREYRASSSSIWAHRWGAHPDVAHNRALRAYGSAGAPAAPALITTAG